MLSEEIIQEIIALLAEKKLSQRAIARQTGVSRVVVHRIATGKRKPKKKRLPQPWEEDRSGRPFERCPHCGTRAQLPCLACLLRNYLRKENPTRFRDSSDFTLHLQLEEPHKKRYEQVRAWRLAQNDPDFTEVPENWPFLRNPRQNRKLPPV